MWEHIDGLYGNHTVVGIHIVQIAGLSGRIAGYVDDALRGGTKDGFYYVGMHACTWRVGDDNIRTAVFGNKLICKNILHIAGIEQCVLNIIYLRVDLCILDCLGHVFNTYNFLGFLGYKVGNGSCAGIEVVNKFITSKFCEVASYTVEMICLLGIGLIETLRTDLELQSSISS